MHFNAEICAVTGGEANASFSNGRGSAWFGSRFDTNLFVMLKNQIDGPLCDDEIEARIADGAIVAYGSYIDGLLRPSRVGEDAARKLFAIGAHEQIEAIHAPKDPKPIRSASAGRMVTELETPILPPAWLGAIPQLSSLLEAAPGPWEFDFVKFGAAYALVLSATGLGLGGRQEVDRAAAEIYRFALDMEKAQDVARESMHDFAVMLTSTEIPNGAVGQQDMKP